MTAVLVSVHIPVVPVTDTDAAVLLEYRYRAMPDQRDFPIQPVFSNDPDQKRKFRELAAQLIALEAGLVLGKLPARFSTWVEVTVTRQIHTYGDSNMLGAAAGFIAARAADYAVLRTLASTGTLRLPTSTSDDLGHCIEVKPVAGVLKKLDAVLAQAQPPNGLLVKLPADDHPEDIGDSNAIRERIARLRARGDQVLRVTSLKQVLAAWIPADAWATPELAAAYAGLQSRPGGAWRKRLVTALGLGALAWTVIPLKQPPHPVPPVLDADRQCAPDGHALLSDPAGGQAAADLVCRAVVACDTAAGSPLDPDRHERGFAAEVDFGKLQEPVSAASARKLCEAAQLAAPTSAKTQWRLSRVHEAQGDTVGAARLREQAANAGDPLARLRLAEDLRDARELTAARDQFQLLANRPMPPPDAVYEYARMA